PERIDLLFGMQGTNRIRPALPHEPSEGFTSLDTEERIIDPALGLVHVPLGWDDVEISGEHHGRGTRDEPGGMTRQPLEPAQLVVESRTRRRVAIGQIQAADDDLTDLRFDVAAVGILGITGEHAADLTGLTATGEYRIPVPAFLAVPDHSISGRSDGQLRAPLLRCFQFLETDDIGGSFIEPAQEVRQPCG